MTKFNHTYTNESANTDKNAGVKASILEAVLDIVHQSDNAFYEFLYDMKSDSEIDNCDYCAAFMLV